MRRKVTEFLALRVLPRLGRLKGNTNDA
jgi:hypothetical protein